MGPTVKRVTSWHEGNAFLERGHKSKPVRDGAPKHTSVSEEHEDEEEGCDDAGKKENGYGKTPAEVIGLKHLAAAVHGPADNGGSVPSVDPSQDEEEEQMVVLGDDDGETSPTQIIQAPVHLFCRVVRPEIATSKAALSVGSLTFLSRGSLRLRRPTWPLRSDVSRCRMERCGSRARTYC